MNSILAALFVNSRFAIRGPGGYYGLVHESHTMSGIFPRGEWSLHFGPLSTPVTGMGVVCSVVVVLVVAILVVRENRRARR